LSFPDRPNRNRFISADVSYDNVGGYNLTYRGDSRLIRQTLTNHASYLQYRLVESAATNVDSKQPWGFNIESLEASLTIRNYSLASGLRWCRHLRAGCQLTIAAEATWR